MHRKAKRAILYLIKPKAIFFGIAIFLLIQARYYEANSDVCCFDCTWTSRHALFLVIASLGLILSRPWTLFISLIAGVKVTYAIGYQAFFNHVINDETQKPWLRWSIIKESLKDTLTYRPLYFIEISVALIIIFWSGVALSRYIFQKLSIRHNGL